MTYEGFLKKKAEITRELADVAMGRRGADLVIKNASYANVHLGVLEENIDLLAYKGIIAFMGKADGYPVDKNSQIYDARGAVLIPGLIDSHMHVESSMVDLRSFAEGILPHGTTSICPDIHEMTNVLGMKALEIFHASAEGLPLNVLTAMPVCVPSIPGMEDAAGEITARDAARAYKNSLAQLQGEQMNFPGVIFSDPFVHGMGAEALKAQKVMTGHYSSPDIGAGLNAYIASGMSACHESTKPEEALAKAGRGMHVQMRYGSAWLDLPQLLPAILDNPGMDTRMFTMVTDDVTPRTIAHEGHLIRVLRKAVQLGLEPIKALQMVTINAAQLLGYADWIGSLAPGKAGDILMVDNLENFSIKKVFVSSKLVADESGFLGNIPPFHYPSWAMDSVHVPPLKEDDFFIKANPETRGAVKTRVIALIPGAVHTREEIWKLEASSGGYPAIPEKDLAKLAIFYRHKKTIPQAHRKSLAFVSGLKFQAGTAYASTVSHDCHNLLLVGNDDHAMALAGNTLIQSGGGLALVHNGKVLAHMALPFAGLMSVKSVKDAAGELTAIEEALKTIGCPHASVEMTISLLALIVLPELHLSNRGLVLMKNGEAPRFVDLFLTE